MTTHSPADDCAALRESTARLLESVAKLSDPEVSAPSRLPGWTRGHVLAHLARNSDALLNVLAGRPMYVSAEARDADIESGAPRPAAEQMEDVAVTALRLDGAFEGQPDGDAGWERTVELRNGVTDRVANIPWRRWIETELHHVDLGVGYELTDVPADFVEREIANMAARYQGHADLAVGVELRTGDGRSWRTGAAEGEPLVVTGTPVALMGWITGRADGSGLSAPEPLPALPTF
ncbi:maleylpyruvate isomerase family mycothiol-dependent enzyme [Streptomyces sp. RKND-216]|uniref:maleylpyruvate isomerase family mycothiol-dependent enzyme n=1 Tax=Streptomyces sp. RKND-216 TaxID=2562581 RepID=UPI00109D8BFC|nr:maleylpyruvate isomerase family mycothiol-dependent enzyme [Streptomyces sp. RKND-216]THA26976.1 maleylpyruvate isomerase family mycothiol-dependent enzyme [Streptomyces sp. RKND-216]